MVCLLDITTAKEGTSLICEVSTGGDIFVTDLKTCSGKVVRGDVPLSGLVIESLILVSWDDETESTWI